MYGGQTLVGVRWQSTRRWRSLWIPMGKHGRGVRTVLPVGNGTGRCEKVQKRYRSLNSSGLSIYRMTRPHWPLCHWVDSGPGLSGFPILPLREYPAHTKVKDNVSKSRRTKESKKERLSTNETDWASTWMLPNKKQNWQLQVRAMTPATLTQLNVTSLTTARGRQPSTSKINHNSINKQDQETQLQLKLIDAHTGAVLHKFLPRQSLCQTVCYHNSSWSILQR